MNPESTGFLNRQAGGMKYVVYVPDVAKVTGLPVILYLHGMGESGKDGLRQTAIGLPDRLRRSCDRWPFLIVMPQKPTADQLWPLFQKEIDAVLTAVQGEFEPDAHRRYITGLSQGGNGTYELCERLTWNFAAAAPICGWLSEGFDAKTLTQIPIWSFHGDLDPVVTLALGQAAVDAIKEAGGDVKFTRYPKLTHNSWDAAYDEAELPQWFLSHQH